MSRAAAPELAAANETVPATMRARTAAAISVGIHAAVLLGAAFFARLAVPPAVPPSYAVELVAAPAGERSLGAVAQGASTPPPPESQKSAADEEVAPAPAAPKKPVAAPPKPAVAKPATPPTRPATPRAGGSESTVAGPKPAGGGPTGGRGRDVANVRVQGIAFPYPGYLENITRQIALNFRPKGGVGLRAEVTFLIRRDGSVAELRMSSRSGAYAFDLECLGAVEAVGQRRSFGPLPAGFRDDVLPVVFSFDPTVLR
jgi:periplasmic protein TonB